MISGTFHAAAQEWRYYSREKSLIHTLHLSQIPPSGTGESVLISATPPTGTAGSNFSVPPLNVPVVSPFGGNIQWTQVVNNFPPLWAAAFPSSLPSFLSGQHYGNWSGVHFSNLFPLPIHPTNVGTWFLPATGGTFVQMGGIVLPFNVGVAGTVLDVDISVDLVAANPLQFTADGSPGAPPPSDYADNYYPWKVVSYLDGDGWGGNQFIPDGGNAVTVEPQTIITRSLYFTWFGDHITLNRNSTTQSLPGQVMMRLGP